MRSASDNQDYSTQRVTVEFHGYTVSICGTVFGKKGQPLKPEKRARRGGGFDLCVRLYYRGKAHKWTLQRLVAVCFIGPIHGYEVNHKDRDPLNNHVSNLERLTPSENQLHWRRLERDK